jgi:hypothetical protein
MASQVLEEMVIKISAETGNLTAEMAKVKTQLESVGSTAKREAQNTHKMGEAFAMVAGAAGGFLAIHEVTKFLSEAGHAAVTNSKSFEVMALTLKNATGASREQADEVDKQIESLSTMSNVLASNIRPSFDIFVRSTKDTTTALQMQKLALDVSAGTGKDLTTVSMAMAKAYEGSTVALNKIVPSVKNATDKFGALNTQFAGAAKIAADADPYAKMKNAMEQIQVAVGKDLLPILQKFADWVSSTVPQVQAFFQELGDSTTPIGKQFKTFTDNIMGFFNTVIDNLPSIIGWATALASVAAATLAIETGMRIASAAVVIFEGAVNAAKWALALFDVAEGAINPAALAIGISVIGLSIAGIGAAAQAAAGSVQGLTSSLNDLKGNQLPKVDLNVVTSAGIQATSEYAQRTKMSYKTLDAMRMEYEANQEQFSRTHSTRELRLVEEVAGRKQGIIEAAQKKLDGQNNLLRDQGKKATDSNAAVDFSALSAKITAAADKANAASQTAAQTHATKLADTAKKHAETIAKQQQAFADKLKSIVDKSLQSLRDAFTQAAQVDIGSMFATMQQQGDTSADSLLASLKDKLAKIQQLARDTAALAGAGFSELFIQQVVAQGPEVGDAMAQSILGASGKTQADLKSSFSQAQTLGAGSFITGSKTSLSAKELLAYGSSSGGQNVIGSSSAVTINAPVSVQTNASPMQIAQATVSAIKFGVSAGSF